MSSARFSGSKVVVTAVVATLTALGVGTVYVPFFADRDKLRGLHEEADGGLSDRDRREYETYLRQIQQQQQARAALPADDTPLPDRAMPKGNGMWSRMNQQATSDKK